MSLIRIIVVIVLCRASVLVAEPRQDVPHRPVRRYAFGERQSVARESVYQRRQRALNSPSLYAGPYPGGGLYAWRQWYYARLPEPLLKGEDHRPSMLLPYSRELLYAQSPAPDYRMPITESEDPVTQLQRRAFTDKARSAEDLYQLRLGY